MKFYEIEVDTWEEGTQLFGTLKEARAAAREALRDNDDLESVPISLIATPPLTRKLFLDVVNSRGGRYQTSSEVIEVIKRRGKGQ